MQRISFIILVVLSCFVCVGCEWDRQQPDIIVVAGGRVESDLDVTVEKATEAAKIVLGEYKQTIVQYTVSTERGHIVAYTQTSQRIEMDIFSAEKGSRIRVSTEGQSGEQISATLIKAIKKRV